MIEFILGGARSGKSRFAEERVKQLSVLSHSTLNTAKATNTFTYIATGQAHDNEMDKRIKQHQFDRKKSDISWQLIEEPIALASCLNNLIDNVIDSASTTHYILVDCLTLWITNCLCAPLNAEHNAGVSSYSVGALGDLDKTNSAVMVFQHQKSDFLAVLQKIQQQKKITLVLVSNEVGHGIVPLGELSREFVDQSGWLHQEVAQIAHKVDFIMAGLPLSLKAPAKVKK